MSNRNQRIREQLGMSHGAAAGKLRKNILFTLLRELERNYCYICKEEISCVKYLSIEHIEPWEGRPNGEMLFWGMDNITFSHTYCNKPHNTGRKEGPEGTAWCCVEQKFVPIEKFAKNVTRWNGLQSNCKDCDYSHRKR